MCIRFSDRRTQCFEWSLFFVYFLTGYGKHLPYNAICLIDLFYRQEKNYINRSHLSINCKNFLVLWKKKDLLASYFDCFSLQIPANKLQRTGLSTHASVFAVPVSIISELKWIYYVSIFTNIYRSYFELFEHHYPLWFDKFCMRYFIFLFIQYRVHE